MTDTIREILARYGVSPETVPLHGEDVTPLGRALGRRLDVVKGDAYTQGARDLMTAREAAEKAPRDVRLDPDTLLWVAVHIARRGFSDVDIPQTLGALATRERERAPDLADWVAAACRSRLGAPTYEADADGYGFVWDKVIAEVLIEAAEGGAWMAVLWHESIDKGHRAFTTPAELRAELDRIAGGGS